MANNLRYPEGIIGNDTDYTSINIVKYQPPGTSSSGGNDFTFATTQESSLGAKKQVLGNIILPIPTNLRDSNNVNWQDSRINSIALGAVGALGDVVDSANLQGFLNDPLSQLDTLKNTALDKAAGFAEGLDANTREQLKDYFLAQAVNVFGANIDPEELISRNSGQVLNPNLELLFRGVKLRTFTYTYDLTPRSSSEAQQVKGIINTFKRRMAAKSSASGGQGSAGIFISAPDIFEIEFKKGGKPHPFLYKMKACALSDMQVSYNGTGNYATYADGTPVKMAMQLTFREVNPIYEEDYNDSDVGVGF